MEFEPSCYGYATNLWASSPESVGKRYIVRLPVDFQDNRFPCFLEIGVAVGCADTQAEFPTTVTPDTDLHRFHMRLHCFVLCGYGMSSQFPER